MQGNKKKIRYHIWLILLCNVVLMITSCKSVKNAQVTEGLKIKKTNGINIDVIGDMPNTERRDLKFLLAGQVERRLKSTSKKVRLLGFIPYSRSIRANYDTVLIRRSTISIKNALIENGYFLGNVRVDTNMKKGDAIVNFRVTTNKAYKVKSFHWELPSDSLKKYTFISSKFDSIIQINKPFTKTKSNNELQRFVNKLRNNGYYRISGLDFRAEIDTSNIALRESVFDLEDIIAANKRARAFYQNPTLDYFIVRRANADSNAVFKQYRIGNVVIMPDENVRLKKAYKDTSYFNNVTFVRNAKLSIYNRLIAKNIFIHKGALFNQDSLDKTLIALNKLDVWRNIKIQERRIDTLNGLIDFDIKMTPAFRDHIELSLDASRNLGGQLRTGTTTLWGFGLTASYTNRNVAKTAIKSSTSLTGLLELRNINIKEANRQLFLKQQFTMPRLPFASWNNERNTIANTFFTVNMGLVNQINFLRYTSIELGAGIDFKKGTSPFTFKVKPLNYEIYARTTFTDFDDLLLNNPLLVFIYRDGIIAGMQVGGTWYNESKHNRKATTRVSFNLEESGLTWGSFIANKIRFTKLDLTVVRNVVTNIDKGNTLAMRLNVGFGYELDNTSHALPIFRKYISGGPTSMRAWRIRGLGPGGFRSTKLSLTQAGGDMQFEYNIEQRNLLPIRLGSLRFEYCLFADVGNTFNNESANFANSGFSRNTFFQNIGIATGTGLRVDFGFIKARLDFAYKFKDPARNSPNGFPNRLNNFSLKENKLDVNDGSPPGNESIFRISNYALQLGINYPF
jgi:outer membrane protein insertion porin family